MAAPGALPASQPAAWSCPPPPGPPPSQGEPALPGPARPATAAGAPGPAPASGHGTSKTGTGDFEAQVPPLLSRQAPGLGLLLRIPPGSFARGNGTGPVPSDGVILPLAKASTRAGA